MSVPLINQTGPLSIFGSDVHAQATSISLPSRCSQRPSHSLAAPVRIAERMQSRAAARSPSGT